MHAVYENDSASNYYIPSSYLRNHLTIHLMKTYEISHSVRIYKRCLNLLKKNNA